jgi:hypothetical protein
MTAKAALVQALLDGRVLNIKNCFETIGLTNCPREISRMVEQPFGVVVSRVQREGKSRYGQPVTWVDYRLNTTDYNKEGIEKMRRYVQEQKATTAITTDNQKKHLQQQNLFP